MLKNAPLFYQLSVESLGSMLLSSKTWPATLRLELA